MSDLAPPRERVLKAVRALVSNPDDPLAVSLLRAVESTLDEHDAETRAVTLTAAADRAEQLNPDCDVDFSAGVDWTVGELRAAAIEVTL